MTTERPKLVDGKNVSLSDADAYRRTLLTPVDDPHLGSSG